MYGIYTVSADNIGTFYELEGADGPLRFESISEAESFAKEQGITNDISILPSGYVSEPTQTAH
jgi:hypothetical protein